MSEQMDLGLDKAQARRAFSRAADSYDEAAVLQHEIAQRMLERLDYMRFEPQRLLDAGCGTGLASGELLKRYKKAQVLSLDFALPMLAHTRKRGGWRRRPLCIGGDIDRLPLADHSIDLLFSNLAIQWCNDLSHTFAEFLRVLRPGGLLLFSTFGPDTLHQLRSAWAEVDGAPHVSPFLDLHDIGDLMLSAQLDDPVVDCEQLTLTYETADQLMRELKLIGAHNVNRQRPRGMTGKGRMQQVRAAYERFRRDGRLPATYEVIYGHAWAPLQRKVEGETRVSLEVLRGGRS